MEDAGLRFICANYYCRYGEIDLVMLAPQKTIIFVEVKYRVSNKFGHVLEMVNTAKMRKIRLTASHFLLQHPSFAKLACRFDVIGIHPNHSPVQMEILWVEAAFN